MFNYVKFVAKKKVCKQIFFHSSLLLLFLDSGSGMGKNQDPQHCFFGIQTWTRWFLVCAGMSNLKFLRKVKESGSGTELLKNLDADPQPREGFNGGRHLPESLLPPQPIVGFVLLGLQLKKENQMI
jgi:hypothetical protein